MRISLAIALASLAQAKTDVNHSLRGRESIYDIDGSLDNAVLATWKPVRKEQDLSFSGPASEFSENPSGATMTMTTGEDDAPDATWKPVRREDDGLHSILDAGRWIWVGATPHPTLKP